MSYTPFDTKTLWEIYNEAAGPSETTPANILAKAQLVNAVLPEITYNPAQLDMVLRMAVLPTIREQYPEIPDSQSADEAAHRLGPKVVLESDERVTGQNWYIDLGL